MLGFVMIGFLAAFGAFCALWILLGSWLIDAGDGHIILFPAPGKEETAVRRYLWLWNLGLVKEKLTVVSDSLCALSHRYPGVRFLTRAQFLSDLEQEREERDGT